MKKKLEDFNSIVYDVNQNEISAFSCYFFLNKEGFKQAYYPSAGNGA